ncbi:MAG: GGDEF domain-containing protein [Burkholderiales bacterium]
MQDVASPQASRQSLIEHLESRLANSEIERALGGFALVLIKFYGDGETTREPGGTEKADTLAAMSTQLRGTLRDSDFFAQFDERTFAAVIPQFSDRATVERIIQKLSIALSRPLTIQGCQQAGALSPKFGFSLFPSDGTAIEALIAHAEKAL